MASNFPAEISQAEYAISGTQWSRLNTTFSLSPTMLASFVNIPSVKVNINFFGKKYNDT